MILFLVLNAGELTAWYYSAIGDEYAFYDTANAIIDHGVERPFSQRGVYDKQPMPNAANQALVILVFGRDNIGWKSEAVTNVPAIRKM